MNRPIHIDSEALMREISRYLAAVDVFRAESCEPTWLAELGPNGGAGSLGPGVRSQSRRAPRAKRS